MDYNVSSKQEQRGILTGMLLGVGRRDQCNFFIQHALQQRDYVLFKKDVLEVITRKPIQLQARKHLSGKPLLRIQPKQTPLIRVLVQRLYFGNEKVITRSFLNYLTPQGIAIWFMDKGSKSFKKKDGEIHALEVALNTNTSREENELIIAYFLEVWGFRWGLSKGRKEYRLRMGTKEGKRFLDFLRPYVPPPMADKLDTSYNRDGRHLRTKAV